MKQVVGCLGLLVILAVAALLLPAMLGMFVVLFRIIGAILTM